MSILFILWVEWKKKDVASFMHIDTSTKYCVVIKVWKSFNALWCCKHLRYFFFMPHESYVEYNLSTLPFYFISILHHSTFIRINIVRIITQIKRNIHELRNSIEKSSFLSIVQPIDREKEVTKFAKPSIEITEKYLVTRCVEIFVLPLFTDWSKRELTSTPISAKRIKGI